MLIVDDDPVLCDVARRRLTRSGFRVLTAADGKAGLAEACVKAIDVILLDYVLPQLDGLTFLRTLRRERPGPKPAVALFTADWTIEDHMSEIRALNAGVVSKLCDFEELERVIRSYCYMPLNAA